MKTTFAALLAIGMFTTAASAQYCPPGERYGQQRPSAGRTVIPVEKPIQPTVVPDAPVEPAAPIEPVPQK